MTTLFNNTHTNGAPNAAAYPLATQPSLLPKEAHLDTLSGEERAPRVGDWITRRRDKHGNRLPWSYAHSVPTVADKPLRETALARAIETISARDPVTGAELEHYYDAKLRPALQRLIALRREEDARLAAANEAARQHNALLDAEIARVTQADRETLAHLESRLPEAQAAARKVTEAEGDYDPTNPTAEHALRLSREAEEALAAELELPWTPADKAAVLSKLGGTCLTLVVGLIIGLSLGILSGFVPAGNWTAKPLPFALFAVAGIAAATGGKKAIWHSARIASQRYWLGKPLVNWGVFAVVSITVTGVLIAIDACVEREGLMANLRMQELAHSLSGNARPGERGSKEGLYFLMAIILTFGYAVNAYWEGYLSGRYDACRNRIRCVQERRYRECEAVRRARTDVKDALHAIACVQNLQHAIHLLETRIAERTAQLETKRLSSGESLSADACLRIQDAVDNLLGAQAAFDTLFAAAKAQCGGGERWVAILPGWKKRRFTHREHKEVSR